jgi:hypothetical protein
MNQQECDKVVKQINDRLIPAFHEHLDQCAQCRNHPFDLCDTGATLLRLAATRIPRMIVTEEPYGKTANLL